jgi:carbamate kinase
MTQVEVDKNDQAFENPTKPIGKFYTQREAEVLRSHGWKMIFDSGRGFRRVVASPGPKKIIELEIIRQLVESGCIVIAAGGGGIPVIRETDGRFHGVDAVIDKDETSVMLANQLGLKNVLIVTCVDYIYRNFGKENAEPIDKLSLEEAQNLLREGQLGTGSMAPKVSALVKFIQNGGEKAGICSPGNFREALREKSGSFIKN